MGTIISIFISLFLTFSPADFNGKSNKPVIQSGHEKNEIIITELTGG
ncbi:MAG: hypothetical protein KDC85_10280 [Saprospiraceae bacterium]|nr:hypothetical protein [Saprospiraceae bacterium]MCB9325731.1 hypothetical protein [Lewinellaceae bacterium]